MTKNAKIIIAENSGFCFGVSKAVNTVYKLVDSGEKVATFGELIHNSDVTNDLGKKGVGVINNLENVAEDVTIVIRSHGVKKSEYDFLTKNNIKFVDCTCPFVKRIHKIAAKMSEIGKTVFIMGSQNHPEIIGIRSFYENNSQNSCNIFEKYEDLKEFLVEFSQNFQKNIAIFAQTTYNVVDWQKCINLLNEFGIEYECFDTICRATYERQEKSREVAEKVDLMLVIGGKHSSNTQKLFNICKAHCPNTFQIENVCDLCEQKILSNFRWGKIGITAGASTPYKIIREVHKMCAENIDNITVENEEEESFKDLFEASSKKKIHVGERIFGVVEYVDSKEYLVSIGAKQSGYLPVSELLSTDDIQVGQEIEVIVTKISDIEGTAWLSRKKLSEIGEFDVFIKARNENTSLPATVIKVVNGGVIAVVETEKSRPSNSRNGRNDRNRGGFNSGLRIYIPANQTGLPKDGNMETLVRQKVSVRVIEVNETRLRATGSLLKGPNLAAERTKFWKNVTVGATYKGRVKTFTNFGAFIEILPGVDGLLHISDMSWSRVSHPSEIFKIDDVIDVTIKSVNKETQKIALGYRKQEDNPWLNINNIFQVGDQIEVTVKSIASFGAFCKVKDGVEGLIHISQISNRRLANVSDVLKVGQTVNVWILSIDDAKKRINLTMKEPVQIPEGAVLQEDESVETVE